MATANQVIKAALQKILVQAADAPFEADEAQDAIFTMNNFMLDLDASGVSLGYTEVSNGGDEITIPPGALRGLIYNLARELAQEYNRPITPVALDIAAKGLETMRKLGQRIGQMNYGGTLPRGSGNYDYTFRNSAFYRDREQEILAETTGAIGLETGTEDSIDDA